MKIKRILAGVLAATITVSSMANSAFANCLKRVDGHPGLTSGDGLWLVQVYNTGNPEENKPATDYKIDLSAVTGISFTLEVVDGFDYFEGQIGGAIVFQCNGGDIGGNGDELFSKYNWSSRKFWGIVDPELDIYACDDSEPVIAEKIDSYTYRYTYNGFDNPFVEDGVQSIGCMAAAFQEWGSDLCVAEITECNILDKDGNVLLSFDGLGYRKDIDTDYSERSDFTYEILPDGTIAIKGYTGKEAEVKIPPEFDGYTVTSIGYNCFKDNELLTSVTIPDTVTTIENFAFANCHNLQDVTIPKSVKEFHSFAFSGCELLTIYCGEYTEAYKYAKENEIPYVIVEELKGDEYDYEVLNEYYKTISIAKYNGEAEKVNIPKTIDGYTVTEIGYSAFYNNRNIVQVTMPDTVNKIGRAAFELCTNLTTVKLSDNITSIGDSSFSVCKSLTSISIPKGVTSIEYETFAQCSSLKSVKLPEGLKKIATWAFLDCVSMKSITIPKSVTEIEDYSIGYKYNTIKSGALSNPASLIVRDDDPLYTKLPNFKIYCYKDTAGEKYATDRGFDYELLDKVSLKAITGFKASSRTDTTVTLKWNKNSEATGYIIEQYKGNKWVRIAKITNNSTTTHKVTGLSASTRNAFRIQAYKEIGSGAVKSAYTNKLVVYTNPKAMSGFKASSKSDSVINLTWAKNTTATGYILEQYKGNKWVRIAKITNNATTTYKVSGLSASTRNAFRIQAYKEFGSGAVKSTYTDKLVVYTNPKAMTGFKASAKTKNTITLSWDKNATATGYILQQYKGNKWVRIAKITSNATTTYKVSGLTANTRYAFRIQAYKECGSGAVKSAYTNKLVVYTAK